ncbi:glycosyltransferase family 8 protein [Sphingobacterium yanglingense]|uniref:Lipopolysaccharide biosynthesis glycosyltransferase n=1 Tax=Sphingobacterium yanglingense TaxID=1437280 RepID=A0A4R6WJT5_9SPHI|nr:glycosyltransferase family 8 protein [Sphingobacterium yanglingense]TDQ77990.1 lipopolysaccharide biosynthesis glycosyltransferase [Sphingobacterium yanglingense]
MDIIPVVFCFDDNWLLPAGVCISSLLENAGSNTFYDIFILHDDAATYPNSKWLDCLYGKYTNFSIKYRSVGNEFHDAFQIRGITVAAYYRLLIPELIPEYNKIMYHDVDVIFREDLSRIFNEADLGGNYIAGVVSPGFFNEKASKNRSEMGLTPEKYILSGNLIFNSELLRKDEIVSLFKIEAQKDYIHQDMDVINLVCKERISYLSPVFCGTIELFKLAANKEDQPLYTLLELEEMQSNGIVHYNGPKPWNGWCPNFDIWWEYYRKSVFFDPAYYFEFYTSKYDELDKLGEVKLIKLLLRKIAKRLNIIK